MVMSSSQQSRWEAARTRTVILAGALVLLSSYGLQAQTPRPRTTPNPETTQRDRATADAPVEPGPRPMSKFGTELSTAEAITLLREMQQLAEQALAVSRSAERATAVPEVKAAASRVVEVVWGVQSGVAPTASTGEVRVPGWKERWQVSGAEFDANFAKRNGTAPPRITDPRQLGIMGRGLAVRGRLEEISSNSSRVISSQQSPPDAVLASLNNVIGWMYITTGLKGREVQPRISLTHVWDAPAAFWNSTADTGWLREVYSQAVNILKNDYAGDAAPARQHATGLSELLDRVLRGIDADANGVVEAKPMEGGLSAAVDAATRATLQAQ